MVDVTSGRGYMIDVVRNYKGEETVVSRGE